MMYHNYGDKNFFEAGFLVDTDSIREDNVEFIYCMPFDDEEDLYLYGEGVVDLTDSWIAWSEVGRYADVDKNTSCWENLANAVISYYGVETVCGGRDSIYCGEFGKSEIKKKLERFFIDWSEVEAD